MSAQRAIQSVRELHHSFVEWFTGSLANTDADFAPVEAALSAEFELISPRGVRNVRSEILEEIRAAHGRRSRAFEIVIRNAAARCVENDLWLVRYEEWQSEGQEQTGRIASALLRELPAGRFEWLHVHETWLPALRYEEGG